MLIKPKFRVSLNGEKEHRLFIKSLSLRDYEKDNVDMLSLTLAPNSTPPKFGDRLELFMGRDDYYFFGAFYVSTIKESYLQEYRIEATSIDYSKGFKIKKNRTFEGLALIDVLRSIARENNLKTRIDFAKQESIETIEQLDESDGALCARLANDYGCSFKIKNDTLIFIDQDKEFDRREYSLNADDCQSLELEYFASKDFKSVEVSYTDNEGEQRTILVGKGEPKFRSVQNFKTDTEAIQWAQTRLKVLQNQKIRGSLTMVGGVFFAGAFLDLSLRGKKHRMLIKEITHDISPENWEIKMTFESIN